MPFALVRRKVLLAHLAASLAAPVPVRPYHARVWTSWSKWWLPPIVVGAIVLAVFAPGLKNEFVFWDDDANFLDNPNYRGLSFAHLHWMFTTFHTGVYQPLAWLTLGLDYTLWGMTPVGYHLTSIVLHAVSAGILYVLALALLPPAATAGDTLTRRLSAAVGALVFAIHPLRVESVVWATERRDVVSGAFYLLSVLAYVRMAGAPDADARRRWLWTSLGCFAAALLSKALTVVLPAVLLVLDAYPLRRSAVVRWRSLLAEKVPYVALALAAGVVAIRAQAADVYHPSLAEHGIVARLAQASYGLCFYVGKTLAPSRLSPLYLLEQPLHAAEPRYVLAMVTVAVGGMSLFFMRHRWPAIAAAVTCYALTVAPVLGFVQNGRQITADRYTYLACVPFALLAAAGFQRARARVASRVVVAAVLLTALGILTMRQTAVWRDSRTLWDHAVTLDPDNYYAYGSRALAKHAAGDLAGALADFDAALRKNPRDDRSWFNRATLRFRLGDIDGAIADCTEVIRLRPDLVEAYTNRGFARERKGDREGALADYSEALRLNPAAVWAAYGRGNVRAAGGDLDGAILDYTEAIGIQPTFADAYAGRAGARALKADLDGALGDYDEALRLNPTLARVVYGRARVRAAKGDLDGAMADYDETIRLAPGQVEAWASRGLLRQRRGDQAGAISDLQHALDVAPPDWPGRALVEQGLAAARGAG